MAGNTILGLEAAGATCSVALMQAGEIRARADVPARHGHAQLLVPMIKNVMGQADCSLADVDRIAVGIGPGGFTGLRVALATARGLGLALDRPVLGISAFQATAANLPANLCAGLCADSSKSGRILVFIDSRRDEPYVALLDSTLAFLRPPRLMTIAEIAAFIADNAPAFVTGDGIGLWREPWPAGLEIVSAAADAVAVARLAADAKGRFRRPAEPDYLRAPDIGPAKSARLA